MQWNSLFHHLMRSSRQIIFSVCREVTHALTSVLCSTHFHLRPQTALYTRSNQTWPLASSTRIYRRGHNFTAFWRFQRPCLNFVYLCASGFSHYCFWLRCKWFRCGSRRHERVRSRRICQLEWLQSWRDESDVSNLRKWRGQTCQLWNLECIRMRARYSQITQSSLLALILRAQGSTARVASWGSRRGRERQKSPWSRAEWTESTWRGERRTCLSRHVLL